MLFFFFSADSLQKLFQQTGGKEWTWAIKWGWDYCKQQAQDGSMWPDSPVPLTDGERWRSSEATHYICSWSTCFSLYIFHIVHLRSRLLVWTLPSFKSRKKETEGCHKAINNLLSGIKIPIKYFHKIVWMTCICSTYYSCFYPRVNFSEREVPGDIFHYVS